MNGVSSFDKEGQEILREVLNEKDIVIKQLSKQIIDYQVQINNIAESIQDFKRTMMQQLEQHNIQDLVNAGFIKEEESQFHIIIDVTQLIHQKTNFFKLDARIQIIKEINDNTIACKQFLKSYEVLNNQNIFLTKQIQEKDRQNESIINALKDEINKSKEEYGNKIKELQQKIDELQQQKQMDELQSKQIQMQRNISNVSRCETKDKYDQLRKQREQHIKAINEITAKNEELTKINMELSAKLKLVNQQKQQIELEQKEIIQKYEQLQGQYNKFVTSSQDNDSFSKVHDFQNHIKKDKNEIKALQAKNKILEQECASLKSQNTKYIDYLRQIKVNQQGQNTQHIQSISPPVKLQQNINRQRPKEKNKSKKLIRLGY